MNENVVRAMIDRIAAAVHAFGRNTDNGVTPKLADVRAWPVLEGCRLTNNDTTGFDEPWREGATWPVRRDIESRGYEARIRLSVLYNPETKEVYEVKDGHSSSGIPEWLWLNNNGHAKWLDYQEKAWTKTREIDVRHLNDDEIEALHAIMTGMISSHPGNSTHITVHLRMSQDQIQSATQRKNRPIPEYADSWSEEATRQFYPYRLPHPHYKSALFDLEPLEMFRATAPKDMVENAQRILNMFDELAIKKVDRREMERHREMAFSGKLGTSVEDMPWLSHDANKAFMVTVDTEGREEGYAMGWPLKVFGSRHGAEKAKERADRMMEQYLTGTPEQSGEAASALYRMFPRLKRDNMLNDYTVFAFEEVDSE